MKVFRLLFLLLTATPAAWAAEPIFEIRAVAERPGPPAREYVQAEAGEKPEKVYLEPEILLDMTAVRSASAAYADNDRWMVQLDFTGKGSDRLAEITTKYLGKRIAVLINGKLLSSPRVLAVIRGSMDIGGDFTADGATGLAADLNAVAKASAATPGNP